MQQAVTADIDVIVRLDADLCQIVGRQPAFGADTGNKGALGAGFGERNAQSGVLARVDGQGHLDAFGVHSLTRQVTELALAMAPQIHTL